MPFAPNFVPHPVTHTSSRLLEFETLRDLLAGYASSPLGQRRIAELRPSLDHAWLEQRPDSYQYQSLFASDISCYC